MIKKLRQKKGETLIETLCSLLIVVLSVLLLSTAVLTASRINMQMRQADENYQSELKQAEGMADDTKKEMVDIRVTFGTVDGATLHESTVAEVLLYGGEESMFLSYDYMPEVDVP